MTIQEIKDKLYAIVSDYTGIDVSEINDTISLRGEMALDSFQIIAMVTEMEDTFGFKISESDMAGFEVLGDIAEYVNGRLNA